ncbi:MAG: hypothetical protein SWH68_10740 [Thermodesulfobacteriota bacterium]|nr:hypothetical protein [Thermodesulfobacteriota bacterium]
MSFPENTSPDKQSLSYADIRSRFDEVLAHHLNRLIEMDFGEDSLSFDLSTVTCLLLLVEQENTVRQSPDSEERFTQETFLEAVSELGVEVDDTLLASFETLMQYGYVTLDKDNRYRAQIAAFALVDFFNNLFAGLPGMNLVTYVIQMISESLEGRKPLDMAVESLDKTLHAKGVPLSRQKLDSKDKASVKESLKRQKTATNVSRQATAELRRTYLQKLSELRKTTAQSRSGEPAVFMKGSEGDARVKIRDVFPKADSPDTVDTEAPAPATEEGVASDSGTKTSEPGAAESNDAVSAPTVDETPGGRQDQAMEDKTDEAPYPPAPPVKEAGGDEIIPEAVETTAEEESADAAPSVSVEDRIQAYEQSLAMTCPVCQTGKIQMEKTEKDIPYYACTNRSCGFISWGKPYAFTCPACNNPFLVEFYDDKNGEPGLKCPRAACSFFQHGLGHPSMAGPGNGASQPSSQKRKKLVRVRRKK